MLGLTMLRTPHILFVEQLPIICRLCGTPYSDDECPTCRQEREDGKRPLEERLRERTEETYGLISDLEEWLESPGDAP